MKKIYKEVGETPLEALDKFRLKNPELKNEKLSYIGRLDPMAEGEIVVLVGEEENKNRRQYLNSDKEYEAVFVVGFKTDTNDILGLVEDYDFSEDSFDNLKERLQKEIYLLKEIKKQKYPWFSSKTVKGKPLFQWFKSGLFKNIERPEREVEIKEIEILSANLISKSKISEYIFKQISKIKGDFRQEKTIKRWQEVLDQTKDDTEFFSIAVKFKVTTGTYIRGLAEILSDKINYPVMLLKLKRTKIFEDFS